MFHRFEKHHSINSSMVDRFSVSIFIKQPIRDVIQSLGMAEAGDKFGWYLQTYV
jgi:hypothetical protein